MNALRPHLVVAVAMAMLAGSCDGGGTSLDVCTFLPGDLVITEIMADPDGADDGHEWFELYNASAAPLNLAGLTLEVVSGRGSKVHLMRSTNAPTLAPMAYLTLGDGVEGETNLGYSYTNLLGTLPNETGTIILRCGTTEVDRVAYGPEVEGPGAPRSGKSLQLTGAITPEYHANDSAESWCDSDMAIPDTENFGTPGAANTPCPGSGCPDGMGGFRPARLPLPGELVINEIYNNTAGAEETSREWVEVYVAATQAVDLQGVELLYGETCDSSAALEGDGCITVQPGAYVVLARTTDTALNGGVAANVTFGGSGLRNDDGCIALQIAADATLIDQTTYGTSTDGSAFSLDPAHLSVTDNDDAANWCLATLPFGDGAGRGTPGVANAACGVVFCDEGGSPRPVLAPAADSLIITEVFGNPDGTDEPEKEWFEIKVLADCDLNGLAILNTSISSGNTRTFVIDAVPCLRAYAGHYVVVAGSTDTALNGGLPQDDVFAASGLSLYNSASTITVQAGATVIDMASYPTPVSGVSSSLNPTMTDTVSNDTDTNFCSSTTTTVFSGTGTPGQENDACL